MIQFVSPDASPLRHIAVCHPAVGPLTVTLDARDAVVAVEWGTRSLYGTSSLSHDIERLFNGEDVEIKVSPHGVTPLQLSVLQAVAGIPFGQVASYSAIAVRACCPRAVRAVATAVGRNPIPLVLPCHRVLPAKACPLWPRKRQLLFDKPSMLGHYTPCDSLKHRLLLYEINLKKP